MIQETLKLLTGNSFFEILLIAVFLDTTLGVLRAIKDHKFNSCVGIDGAIRKVAMMLSVGVLMLVDIVMHVNVLFMVPDKYIQLLGIQKLGVCEFFCLLFTLYETVSILKNMTLCGLPVPEKLKNYIQKFLNDMTDELSEEE
jgi:toxin secretion/phage lysis holin|nr:MAG TPA: holin [Caudoviricetes sp.]